MKHDACLRCQKPLNHFINIADIFAFKKIIFSSVCQSCQSGFLKSDSGDRCRYCQHPIGSQSSLKQGHPLFHESSVSLCHDCLEWLKRYPESYFNHRSLFDYNETFQAWITDYKYRGDARQADVMVPVIREIALSEPGYTWTYLPSSPISYAKRQFNPIGYLLTVSEQPFRELFDYIGDASPQAQKNKLDRLALEQPFAIKPNLKLPSKILIIDDVYTTGATLLRAKECIFSAGVDDVKSITLARDLMK